MKANVILIALAVIGAAPALAQQPAEAIVEVPAVDPARLTVARALLETLMPASKRDAMIDGMMQGMMANMAQGMTNSPQFKNEIAREPRARAIFDRFFARQQATTLSMLKTNMPGMIEAMAHAYARRFTVGQMGEMQAFFATPTGRVYMEQATTIMSDPDVARWQRDLMTSTMKRMPTEMEALMAEIKALKPARRVK